MKVEVNAIEYLIENVKALIDIYRSDCNSDRKKAEIHSLEKRDYSARVYSNSAWLSAGKVEAMEYLLDYIERNAHIYH